MPWDGNEGKRMAGVPHSEKSEGFHSSGLPIKTIRHIRNIRCCFFRLQRRNLLHRIHVKDWIYLWVCRTSQPCTPMMKSYYPFHEKCIIKGATFLHQCRIFNISCGKVFLFPIIDFLAILPTLQVFPAGGDGDASLGGDEKETISIQVFNISDSDAELLPDVLVHVFHSDG